MSFFLPGYIPLDVLRLKLFSIVSQPGYDLNEFIFGKKPGPSHLEELLARLRAGLLEPVEDRLAAELKKRKSGLTPAKTKTINVAPTYEPNPAIVLDRLFTPPRFEIKPPKEKSPPELQLCRSGPDGALENCKKIR